MEDWKKEYYGRKGWEGRGREEKGKEKRCGINSFHVSNLIWADFKICVGTYSLTLSVDISRHILKNQLDYFCSSTDIYQLIDMRQIT